VWILGNEPIIWSSFSDRFLVDGDDDNDVALSNDKLLSINISLALTDRQETICANAIVSKTENSVRSV